MDLYLLGPIEARLDGRPIPLGAPKQRAVLAMLALDVGRTVSADRLAEGLWGEQPPPSSAKMVQVYVSHLRHLLSGNGAQIVTRGRGYELRLSDGDVDAVRFAELIEHARAREALALWRGEALADLADEPFAAAEIRRLEQLRLRAAELAVEADLAAGRHVAVITELEALVAQHPLRERLQAQRMLALYRSGRQSEALEAYGMARIALVEVGVEPGAELRRLQAAILAQDPALDVAAPPPASEARPPPRRRFVRGIAAVALLVLAGLAALGISRVMQPDGLPRIDEQAVGAIDPASGRITAQYRVGRGPGAIAVGGGSVWVANALDGTVTRIDREADEVVTIPVGGKPSGLVFGAGSLWVADGSARNVVQIDPRANKVLQRVDVANAPRGVAIAGSALWIVTGVDGAVHRIALDRTTPRRSIPIGANPTAIAADAGAIWAASEEAGTVTRLDPRSGAVVQTINVGNGPTAVAAGERAVWVVSRHGGTLTRIDRATNAVSWTVRPGSDPTAVAAGAGGVWVAGGEEGTVARVDPSAPRVLETIEAGSSPAAIAATGGSVWTATVAPQVSHRGGTLRLLLPRSNPPHSVPIDWLDEGAYAYDSVMVNSLAYDGLVGYRRVAGAAGATLVGALAMSAPRPSDDGRTYVFTLRRGLRYSDGQPLRPGDFRASIERFLRVTRDTFPPFYLGIVGAEACVAHPGRCDLSGGIVSDPHARTITIHLTRPDFEFLHKLAIPFAYVVPADTPIRLTGDNAPPGTGPYRVAAWDADQGGVLVRNRHFQASAPEARPSGFADRIQIAVQPPRTLDAQIADVERGEADLAIVADPFAFDISTETVGQLTARSPGQVHSVPTAVSEYMFLNVRRRPFDDKRVRRAINYATDRRRIVELRGGREIADPSCQIVPAGFPGHEPYCPYSADSGPGRGWTAPNLERARRLIAESGRTGDRVVITVDAFRRNVGRYFTTLLGDLGFRATLRVLPDGEYFPSIFDPRSRLQIGIVGWSQDFLSASSLIQPTFTCASLADRQPANPSWFCDRGLARQVDRALAAQGGEATGRWAAIDRRIVDLAPAVPLTVHRGVMLVSKRVGNVQSNLNSFALLDQLWVR